ncbi:MAG: DUF4363 family protein [Clostridiales bacterium]|nr:DUF4363 family protein [Clostridiales bacterium]
MRSVIITLIIAVGMVSGSVMYASHLKEQSEMLSEITKDIKDDIINENYSSATDGIKRLDKNVSRFEKFFLATGDHIEIDNIKTNISELKSYTKHKMKGDAMSKIYVLEFLFEHLPHNNQVKIGNIL